MSRKAVEQDRLLQDAMDMVSKSANWMFRAADGDNLRQALKHACGMIHELRTSKLSPQTYFQLYMKVFENLGFLEAYMDRVRGSGVSGQELYDMVQHAEHVLTRLYLLITVGSLYIRSQETPAKDILMDLLDMVKGVQHPTRGLFLRYYLVQMCKDKLPDRGSEYEGVGGTIEDALTFLLGNFSEMTRLWVRLQHPSYSKNRKRRDRERRELREPVGFCLECISNLDGLDLGHFRERVLPAVLAQVDESNDPIAQAYLMEALLQAFPVDFIVQTLPDYLRGLGMVEPEVDLRPLLRALCDRLENELEPTRRAAFRAEDLRPAPATAEGEEGGGGGGASAPPAPSSDAADLSVVGVLASHLDAILRQPDRHPSATAVSELHEQLANFSILLFPGDLHRVNRLLESCEAILRGGALDDSGLRAVNRFLSTLYRTLDLPLPGLLALPGFGRLRNVLTLQYRRSCSNGILDVILAKQLPIDSEELCRRFFRAISPLIRDEDGAGAEDDDAALFDQEQRKVARAVHLLARGTRSPEASYQIFRVAREAFGHGGARRIAHTLPPLVLECLQFTQSLMRQLAEISSPTARVVTPAGESDDGLDKAAAGGAGEGEEGEEGDGSAGAQGAAEMRQLVKRMFQFVHKTCTGLATSHIETALQLFLQCARVASRTKYSAEFIRQAYILYEEVAESKRQRRALLDIIATLRHCGSSGMGTEAYLSQVTHATQYSTKLLRRPDQVECLLQSAHLFWLEEEEEAAETRRPRELLKCLQRALQVADNCMPPSPQLFADIMDAYVYFFERRVPTIQPDFIARLLDLVHSDGEQMSPGPDKAAVLARHHATLRHINAQRETPEGAELYGAVQL